MPSTVMAANGTLTDTASQQQAIGELTSPALTYTPNAGFFGTDSFTFTVTNADGLTSALATVSITVYSIPVANPDAYTVNAGSTLIVTAAQGVLANDTNADGNPLTAQLVGGPANGQLTLNSDGSFSYMPNSGFCGSDNFFYVATDGVETSWPATVTITVYSVPVAVNDTYWLIAGQTLEPDAANGVLANDTNADGNPLTAQLQTGTINGYLILNNDGSFLYLPNTGYFGLTALLTLPQTVWQPPRRQR